MKNPITGVEYQLEKKFVDSLAVSYLDLIREQAGINMDIQDVLTIIEDLAGLDKLKGIVNVMGEKMGFKFTRKQNISYPRERGEEHPLKILMEEFTGLEEMVKLEYKEKGVSIENLIKNQPELKSVIALKKVRVVNQGKSGVEVVDVKENEE